MSVRGTGGANRHKGLPPNGRHSPAYWVVQRLPKWLILKELLEAQQSKTFCFPCNPAILRISSGPSETLRDQNVQRS